jgi:hypothetical protein
MPILDATPTTPCSCAYCTRHRHAESVIASRDVGRLIALVRSMESYVADVESDRDVARCILAGTWPSAREKLAHAMVLADKWAEENAEVSA